MSILTEVVPETAIETETSSEAGMTRMQDSKKEGSVFPENKFLEKFFPFFKDLSVSVHKMKDCIAFHKLILLTCLVPCCSSVLR